MLLFEFSPPGTVVEKIDTTDLLLPLRKIDPFFCDATRKAYLWRDGIDFKDVLFCHTCKIVTCKRSGAIIFDLFDEDAMGVIVVKSSVENSTIGFELFTGE